MLAFKAFVRVVYHLCIVGALLKELIEGCICGGIAMIDSTIDLAIQTLEGQALDILDFIDVVPCK